MKNKTSYFNSFFKTSKNEKNEKSEDIMNNKTFEQNKKNMLDMMCDELVKRNKNKKDKIYERLAKKETKVIYINNRQYVVNK